MSKPLQDPVPLVTACRECGWSYTTAYRLVLTGALPAERRGGRWWVSRSAARQLARKAGKPDTVPALAS